MRSSSPSPLMLRMLERLSQTDNDPELAEMVRKTREAQAQEAAEGPAWPAGYGATNTLVSRERAEELRRRLRSLLGHDA